MNGKALTQLYLINNSNKYQELVVAFVVQDSTSTDVIKSTDAFAFELSPKKKLIYHYKTYFDDQTKVDYYRQVLAMDA